MAYIDDLEAEAAKILLRAATTGVHVLNSAGSAKLGITSDNPRDNTPAPQVSITPKDKLAGLSELATAATPLINDPVNLLTGRNKFYLAIRRV